MQRLLATAAAAVEPKADAIAARGAADGWATSLRCAVEPMLVSTSKQDALHECGL